MGRALQQRGGDIHRNIRKGAPKSNSRLKSLQLSEVGHGSGDFGSTRQKGIYCQGGVLPL
jgi:hypothetical protein